MMSQLQSMVTNIDSPDNYRTETTGSYNSTTRQTTFNLTGLQQIALLIW